MALLLVLFGIICVVYKKQSGGHNNASCSSQQNMVCCRPLGIKHCVLPTTWQQTLSQQEQYNVLGGALFSCMLLCTCCTSITSTCEMEQNIASHIHT